MTGFVVHFVYLRTQNQTPMPARCPECGSFVKKDAESCPRCGADLNAIPLTEPKETQTSGQAATHSSPNKKTKQDKTAEPTKKTRADKTTGTSGNTRKNKTVKSIKKTRTDKTAKTSKKAVQKESVEQPREEADSPYQDTEKYPRLVQEFTAYYNKYQQLRQKAMQQPQKFDKQLKRYLKIRHATPTPPDTPWLGRFRYLPRLPLRVPGLVQKRMHPRRVAIAKEKPPGPFRRTGTRYRCTDIAPAALFRFARERL